MKALISVPIFALALGGVLFFSRVSVLQQVTKAPPFAPSEIPWVLRTTSGATIRAGHQLGSAWLNAMERSVRIEWNASGLANQPPDYSLVPDFANNAVGPYVTSLEEQSFVTRYYPTACGSRDGSSFLVGGISADGGTVIEEWSFNWPDEMPQPVTDPVTALVTVDVVLPAVQMRVVFSSGPEDSPKYVSGICGLRKHQAAADHALVQFHEPNDVVALDLGDGSVSLLASELNPGGSLGVLSSLAAKDYSGLRASERRNVGYVYTFSRGREDIAVQGDAWEIPALVLVDGDRDGTPETAFELTAAERSSQGWGVLEDYVDWWLD